MKTYILDKTKVLTGKSYPVRVIISGNIAFTCDTKEEHDKSVIMQFSEEEAEQLICGFGVDISLRQLNLN